MRHGPGLVGAFAPAMLHVPIGSMYGIYANIGGILMVTVTIYSSTMDPMGYEIDLPIKLY